MASKVLKKVISTPKSPAAVYAYSQAVQADTTLYISGQLGLDKTTLELVSNDVVEQTRAALTNIGQILEAAGCTYKHVVKTTVLLADINDFVKVNEEYSKFFTESKPARAAYQVGNLPKGGRVEIEAIAIVGELDQQAHKKTRNVVERGIGQLKRRFHILPGEIRVGPPSKI